MVASWLSGRPSSAASSTFEGLSSFGTARPYAHTSCSVCSRPCPHAVASRTEHAAEAAARGERENAISIMRDVCHDAPEEPRHSLELGDYLVAGPGWIMPGWTAAAALPSAAERLDGRVRLSGVETLVPTTCTATTPDRRSILRRARASDCFLAQPARVSSLRAFSPLSWIRTTRPLSGSVHRACQLIPLTSWRRSSTTPGCALRMRRFVVLFVAIGVPFRVTLRVTQRRVTRGFSLPSVSAVGNGNDSFVRECRPRADNRMTRKRNFAHGREDAQASQHPVRFRLQHEDGFRQVHLTRDLHHLIVGNSVGLGKDCEGIAAELAVSENVELQKIVWRHE